MPNFSIMQLATDVSDASVARMAIFGDIAKASLFEVWTGTKDESRTEALDVVSAIQALPKSTRTIEVHINSFGGDVSEGVAIYNALRESGRDVTTVCDGFACSIASVVFMAGQRRIMRPASLLMLHNPLYQQVGGNAKQLRKAADDLDIIAKLSKAAYLNGTSIGAEMLDEVMDAETWVTPEQAMEWGLATEVEDAAEDGSAPTQAVSRLVMDTLAGTMQTAANDTKAIVDDAVERIEQFMEAMKASQAEAPTAKQEEPKQEPKRGYARLAGLLGKIED